MAYHVGYYHRGIERRSDFQRRAVEKRRKGNQGGEKRGRSFVTPVLCVFLQVVFMKHLESPYFVEASLPVPGAFEDLL